METAVKLKSDLEKSSSIIEILRNESDEEQCFINEPAENLIGIINGTDVERSKRAWNDKLYCEACERSFYRSNLHSHKQSKSHQRYERLNKNLVKILLQDMK